MDDRHTSARLSILIVSGLLFGGAGASWLAHLGESHEAPTSAKSQLASTDGVTTSSTERVTDQTGRADDASLGLAPAEAASAPRATELSEAARQARASVGREDPMAPVFQQQTGRSNLIAANPRRRYSVPPPPPETTPGFVEPPRASYSAARGAIGQYPNSNVAYADPAPMPKVLIAAEMRLVGLLDDKAIFSIPKETASRLNLPTAVTLGPGQPWNGIKLVGVSRESATLCDEKSHLYTKTLQSIR